MKPEFVFFGHDRFSALTLKRLLKHKLTPLAVVDLPSKPQGRKRITKPSPVELLAQNYQIPVYFYDKKNPDLILAKLTKTKPRLGVLASFGAIIPQKVIDFFLRGILVVHPSLLPKYRGTSPARGAILDRLDKTGVTIILMDAKMDHGPILAQTTHPIKPTDNRDLLLERLFPLGADLIAKNLNNYLVGKLKPTLQNHAQATFTRKITKKDGKIDWDQSPIQLDAHLRAYTPWPGAWTKVNEKGQTKRLKIRRAHLEKNKFVLDEVQLEGKNPVSWKQFREGHPSAIISKS